MASYDYNEIQPGASDIDREAWPVMYDPYGDQNGLTEVSTKDTETVDLTGKGTSTSKLSADVKISTQSGNLLRKTTDGLFVSIGGDPVLSISGSQFIGVTGEPQRPTITLKRSEDESNDLKDENGLYVHIPVKEIQGSDSIDVILDGDEREISVILSEEPDNKIEDTPNGLFVAPDVVSGVSDTSTIGLTIDDRVLSGELKLDPNQGNVNLSTENGLKAEIASGVITEIDSSNSITATKNQNVYTLSLNTDNSGNVQFDITENGLKANVDFPLDTLTGTNPIKVTTEKVGQVDEHVVSLDIASGANNLLDVAPDGLRAVLSTGSDQDHNVQFTGSGTPTNPLKAHVDIPEDFIRGIGETSSLALSVASGTGELTGDVKIDTTNPGNVTLSFTQNGLIASADIPEDYINDVANTQSVNLNVSEGVLTAEIASGVIPEIQGSSSIDVQKSGSTNTLSAKISNKTGNQLSVDGNNGLYVPPTEIPDVPVKSLTEGDGIEVQDDGEGNFTIGANISEDAGNRLEISQTDNGLYMGSELPSGGSVGQVLKKTASGSEWANEQSQYVSGTSNTDTVSLAVELGQLSATANISSATGNILENRNGLYVPEPQIPEVPVQSLIEGTGVNINDDGNGNYTISATTDVQSAEGTDSITMGVDASGTLTANLRIDQNQGNVTLAVGQNGLYASVGIPEQYIDSSSDTNSVSLDVTNKELTASVNISSDQGNTLVEKQDGLYVPAPTIPEDYISSISDTDSIDLSVNNGELSGDVKLSNTAGNILSIELDGLYASANQQEEYVKSVGNTDSISLNVDQNGELTSELNIDTINPGNVSLNITQNGLVASAEIPEDYINNVVDTDTVALSVDNGDLSASAKVSSKGDNQTDPANALEIEQDGLWTPTLYLGPFDSSARPSDAITGQYIFDTDLGYCLYRRGGAWVNSTGAIIEGNVEPSGNAVDWLVNPMTSYGDLLVGGPSGTPSAFHIGPTGTYLKSGENGLEWGEVNSLVLSDLADNQATVIEDGQHDGLYVPPSDLEGMITTAGDLIVGDASGEPETLSKGTVGQILTSTANGIEWKSGISENATVTVEATGASNTLILKGQGGASLSSEGELINIATEANGTEFAHIQTQGTNIELKSITDTTHYGSTVYSPTSISTSFTGASSPTSLTVYNSSTITGSAKTINLLASIIPTDTGTPSFTAGTVNGTTTLTGSSIGLLGAPYGSLNLNSMGVSITNPNLPVTINTGSYVANSTGSYVVNANYLGNNEYCDVFTVGAQSGTTLTSKNPITLKSLTGAPVMLATESGGSELSHIKAQGTEIELKTTGDTDNYSYIREAVSSIQNYVRITDGSNGVYTTISTIQSSGFVLQNNFMSVSEAYEVKLSSNPILMEAYVKNIASNTTRKITLHAFTGITIDNADIKLSNYGRTYDSSLTYELLGMDTTNGYVDKVPMSVVFSAGCPMTSYGDLMVGGASGVPERLGIGTTGQVLTVGSSGLEWATASSGMTNPMTTADDIIVGGASGVPERLAKGTEGQELVVGANGVEWADKPKACIENYAFVNSTTIEDATNFTGMLYVSKVICNHEGKYSELGFALKSGNTGKVGMAIYDVNHDLVARTELFSANQTKDGFLYWHDTESEYMLEAGGEYYFAIWFGNDPYTNILKVFAKEVTNSPDASLIGIVIGQQSITEMPTTLGTLNNGQVCFHMSAR